MENTSDGRDARGESMTLACVLLTSFTLIQQLSADDGSHAGHKEDNLALYFTPSRNLLFQVKELAHLSVSPHVAEDLDMILCELGFLLLTLGLHSAETCFDRD